MYKPMAKSMGKGKFRPPQLRNRLIDFDEIRTLELPPEDHSPCKISSRSEYSGLWVVSANIQFVTVTEKTIFGVHVSPGSAETLVRRGGITNHDSIAYSLSNSCVKIPKSVEVR